MPVCTRRNQHNTWLRTNGQCFQLGIMEMGLLVQMVPHGNFAGLEYCSMDTDHHHRHHNRQQNFMEGDTAGSPADHMLHHHQPPPQTASSFDLLAFAETMQFADYGNKMAISLPAKVSDEYNGMDDPVYVLKFPVLNDWPLPPPEHPMLALPPPSELLPAESRFGEGVQVDREMEDDHHQAASNKEKVGMKLRMLGGNGGQNNGGSLEGKNRKKRPRSGKTSEEVESQRMTHIAVERSRRKQMNEHLRVLRSLMPSSYIQRGDQASIIGGAIEFVRELEQLLHCLESQKRRRLYGGDNGPPQQMGEPPAMEIEGWPGQFLTSPPSLSIAGDQNGLINFDAWLQEETAEIKSCLSDVEVKLLGFDALIKILSRRRPGQLRKTIAALEDLQFNILHTNITTIEQTVLYSFNVKVNGEARFTAEDIANSVHQILNFIHASTAV